MIEKNSLLAAIGTWRRDSSFDALVYSLPHSSLSIFNFQLSTFNFQLTASLSIFSPDFSQLTTYAYHATCCAAVTIGSSTGAYS